MISTKGEKSRGIPEMHGGVILVFFGIYYFIIFWGQKGKREKGEKVLVVPSLFPLFPFSPCFIPRP
jgi:hypothetical protein